MKKIVSICVSTIVLLGTACQKDFFTEVSSNHNGKLIVTASSAQLSKTSVDGSVIQWASKDTIAVFDNLTTGQSVGNKFALVSGSGTTSGSFAGELTDVTAQVGRKIAAAYPYSAVTVSTTGVVTFTLPNEQIQNGSSDPASLGNYAYMVALPITVDDVPTSGNVQFTFKHIVAFMEVSVNNIPVGENLIGVSVEVDPTGNNKTNWPFKTKATVDVMGNAVLAQAIDQTTASRALRVKIVGATGRNEKAIMTMFPCDLSSNVSDLCLTVSTEDASGAIKSYYLKKASIAHNFARGGRYQTSVDMSDAGVLSSVSTAIPFGGIYFMDRNLGAEIPTTEENIDDVRCLGNYYQAGRFTGIPYAQLIAGTYSIANGPLSNQVGRDTSAMFIKLATGINAWDGVGMPGTGTKMYDMWKVFSGAAVAPIGYRVPSNQDLFHVMEGANNISAPTFPVASYKSSYNLDYGDDGKLPNISVSPGNGTEIYDIKKYGTAKAYAVRYEWKTSSGGRNYLKLTAIPGIGALADFVGTDATEKSASAAAMFADPANISKFQVLVFPAMGRISPQGLNTATNYKDKVDMWYWSSGASSANGYGMSMNPNNTTASNKAVVYQSLSVGHACPIRCVKN